MIPTDEGKLVGEVRYKDEKKVTFFCLNLHDGKILWKDRSVEEDWWVGIEGVHAGTVLLHLFARPDMPEHSGIMALDLGSGSGTWQHRTATIEAMHDGCLYVRNIADAPEDLHVLQIATGKDEGRISPDTEAVQRAFQHDPQPDGIEYPSRLSEGEEGWGLFQSILGSKDQVGECEYVHVDERWIFSYHARNARDAGSTSFQQYVAVADDAGKVLYDEVAHTEAHIPVYDSFFFRDGFLYYIRQEVDLLSVRVSPE
jgi:hypothetical protein